MTLIENGNRNGSAGRELEKEFLELSINKSHVSFDQQKKINSHYFIYRQQIDGVLIF